MRTNLTGGLILIALGVIFLLDNLGFFSWVSIWKFWPLILVALGVGLLVPRKN
ncbi:MAG: LiaI-LiaF-like domain-containing protein [Mycobacterium leprae]